MFFTLKVKKYLDKGILPMYDDNQQLLRSRLTLLNAPSDRHNPDGNYNIYAFTGEESLGKPYVYEVSFMSPVLLEVETLVDTDVKVLLQDVKSVDKQREFYGKVYQAKHTDSVGDKHLYTFTVVHPLFYLGLNRRYEIYQDQSAFEVMQTLLTRYAGLLSIDFHTNITPSYFTKREYCTQYFQSDLEFIQMLCEQEGVTLHMETGESTHKVRLAHINETFTQLGEELRCSYNTSKTFEVTHTQENYYDFRIPSKEYLKETGASALSQSLSDNPHTASLRDALLHHTQHDRLDVSRPANLQGLMDAHAKSMYSDAERITGKSQDLEAGIGRGGTLFDTKALKRTQAILTKVTYKGIFPNALEEYTGTVESVESYSYEVDFEATPLNTVFIPHYNITKPIIPSSVTALVSDGSKKEGMSSRANTIDVDSFGRIRVIFHFDSKYPTSCYIRFTNFSAGDGWGSQFIPRVNTEVIVNFLNGDPDRPVAIGSLYNGNNDIPKNLPALKTQSYIKTQSMPGGNDNFNLLLFEDKGGEELVHMQAEKDHLLHVKHDSDNNIDHDERTTVGNDRTENVGNDETIDIGHDRTESVGNDENISIGHDQNNHILNTQANKIDKDKITYVGNHRVDETYANHTMKTGGHHDFTINGKYDVKAGTHIKEVTTVYQIDASDLFKAKGKAGYYHHRWCWDNA